MLRSTFLGYITGRMSGFGGRRCAARLLSGKGGALCLPFANNARHSHEVDAFRSQKLPDRMILVCGVVGTHNYVENPPVIAERLERAVCAVGERVTAGTDCGFGTIVGDIECPRTLSGPSSKRCATVWQ